MSLSQLVALAVIQGVTEFLPISSSGHLALAPHVLEWPDQGLVIDVAVHVGTLGAVLIYTWRDIGRMIRGIIRPPDKRLDPGRRLAWQIVIASIPVMIAGFLVSRYLGDSLRTVEIIAWSTIVFGVLLGVIDRIAPTLYRLKHLTYGTALFIGVAQILALIPGASRSGVTMTTARLAGFERHEAARLSLLLAIPAILGAGTLTGLELYLAESATPGIDAIIAAGLALITALLSISLMMAWLRRAGFLPFVIYRLLLGTVLLIWVYN